MKEEDESAVQAVILNYGDPETDIRHDRLEDYDNNEYISFGKDNLFPQAVALMARSSPNHRAVINSKTTYFMGDGIISEDPEFMPLLKQSNFEGETISAITERVMLDDNIAGNGWFEIISDPGRSFLWFSHLDTTKCRLNRTRDGVIIHPNWQNYEGKTDKKRIEMPLYPDFEMQKNSFGIRVARSVFHVKQYEPEFVNYGLPLWIAGKDSVEIDLKTNKWNLARLENAFNISGFLVVPVKDTDESKKVIDRIKNSHIGEGKQGKLMVVTKSRAREGEKADTTQLIETKQTDDGSWVNLHSQSLSDVVISHGWYRALTGIADNTGFDTQRILNEYYIALSTIITKKQKQYVDIFKKIFREQRGKEVELEFKNTPPLSDDNYHYVWEMREKKGLDSDKTDPNQMVIILKEKTVQAKKEKDE